MLRAAGHRQQGDFCWKNSLKDTVGKTTPEGQGM